MTNILSAISGQFSRALAMGTFFPVVLFVIFGLIFVVPLFPPDWPLLKPLETLGTGWDVVVITFVTFLITGLLYNLNIPIIRLYEGYPWRHSTLGQRRIRYYKEQFINVRAQRTGMRKLLTVLDEEDERIPRIESSRTHVGRKINSEYPTAEDGVLPTRLGNVIRSFEDYPDRQYGMGAVTLWPRLIAKVDKDYGAAIGDAKTSFDFMLNSSLLSVIMALLISTVGLVYFAPLASLGSAIPWLLEIIAFLVLAYVLYTWSIGRAGAWGNMVKGAFDLYRWDLLKQLGYKRTPEAVGEEIMLWDTISRQMIFGYPPKDLGRPADYASTPVPPTFARGNPPEARLEITRALQEIKPDGVATVVLHVKNVDAQGRAVQGVVVTDTLPTNFSYIWESASLNGRDLPVVGTNPYRFHIGTIDPSGEVVVSYLAIPIVEK